MKKRQKKNKGAKAPGINAHSGRIIFASEEALYRRNMEALRLRYPELARQVEKTMLRGYKLVPASTGLLNLYLLAEDAYYYDHQDPLKDVQEQLAALELKNTRLAVFLGLGLGYQLLYFLRHMAKEQHTSHILILEKDLEIFKAALKATNLVPLLENGNISFMVGLPPDAFYVQLRQYLAEKSRFILLKAMKAVYHSSALRLHKDYYLHALKQLRESGAHQVLNFGNDPKDSLIGVENMLENIGEIVYNPGINLLFEKFKGKPAVIVATGPSLNKNKYLLKGLEKKALLLAPDASLKIMLAMGVKPHVVVALERTMGIYKMFDGLQPDEVKDVYLAACPVIDRRIYAAYPGPRIIVYRNFDHFKWLGLDKGILEIKLSAGNMAFKIAEALGCDPIILIGQDLAFSPEGNTHAAGMALGEKREALYQRGVRQVMGNDGKPILTSNVWYPFIKAYELDLAQYRGTCINSTEGGAYIKGTTLLPFKEAIDRYLQVEYDPLAVLKEALAPFSVDEAQRDLEKVKSLIEQATADLEEMLALCEEGLKKHGEYRETLLHYLHNPKESPLRQKELAKIHREVVTPKKKIAADYYHTYQLFFMHIFQSYHIKFEMEMVAIADKYDDPSLALADFILQQAEWYLVCQELMAVCLQSLAKAKGTLLGLEKVPLFGGQC